MLQKTNYYRSASFAALVVGSSLATLTFSAPIARAATLNLLTGEGGATPIGDTNAIVMGNTVSVPAGETFTDVTFTVSASNTPSVLGGNVNVTGTRERRIIC